MKLEELSKKKIMGNFKPKFPQKYSMLVKGGKKAITPPQPDSQNTGVSTTGTELAIAKPQRAKFLGVQQPQNGVHP